MKLKDLPVPNRLVFSRSPAKVS